MISVKLRIRELREDHDLTQSQISKMLMCDQSLYSKYEREVRSLSLENAIKLARYYGVSLDYLAGLTEEQEKLE